MAYKLKQAFTIIELLVVIVVIGILASVVIVSFSGVSQKAITASINSDLVNSAKKLKLYQAEFSTYPYAIDCSASPIATSTCITASNGTTYTYRGKSNDFCLSATNGTTSYYITESNNIASGVCTITNYVTTPGFEGGAAGSGSPIGGNGGTPSIQSGLSQSGTYFYRANFTSNMVGRCQWSSTLQPGLYRASFWVRSNQAVGYTMYFDNAFYNNNTYRVDTPSTSSVLAPNIWTKFVRLFNLSYSAQVCIGGYVPNFVTWTASDYLDIDSVLVTEGTTNYNFADGNSSGWTWSGTANNSTSSGLPI